LLVKRSFNGDRVDESLAGNVAVAPIARCRPREPFVDEMLAKRNVWRVQHEAVGTVRWPVAVRIEHELAVPLLRNLDAIETARILARKLLRACNRRERPLRLRPWFVLARNRREHRLKNRSRVSVFVMRGNARDDEQ
jgi:hypothetical protein